MLMFISSAVMFASLSAPPPAADAHRPLESTGNNDYAGATTIPDHRVSWAIYKQLQRSGADYYRFNAAEGDRFYMQMTVPALEQYQTFAPTVALVGEGMHQASLTLVENSKTVELEPAGAEFDIPSGAGDVIVFNYDNPGADEKFFEPFTQTSYLVRQELTIERLPSTGTYTLVVFDRAMQADSAKYVLAVGEREEFSFADYFTTLPAAWFEVKLFFNDYASVGAALALIFGSASLMVALVIRKKLGPRLQSV
jgi:hypothetical protein